jgi:predicted homoserine dehydrogenase-like protein
VATAQRDLAAGETLDGEGGFTVYGRLMPAADSLAHGALPIGLAHNATLQRPVKEGEVVSWRDVVIDESGEAVRFRREMEGIFRQEWGFGGVYPGAAAAY